MFACSRPPRAWVPSLEQQSVRPGSLRTCARSPVNGRSFRRSRAVPANPRIAIIAFQQAVAATNEGQRNFAQLRVKFEPKQAALKAQSDEIDSLKKQLQDAGSTLSEPERDSRLRTIDEKTKSLQRSAEDAQNEASTAMNDMYQQLAQKVYAVLDAYSNQNKFTLVLDTSAQQTPVLWANQASDITKAVVDAYNAKSGVPPQPAAGAPAAPRPSTPTRAHTGDHTTAQHDQATAVDVSLADGCLPGRRQLKPAREFQLQICSAVKSATKNLIRQSIVPGCVCGKSCGKPGMRSFRIRCALDEASMAVSPLERTALS